MISPERQDNKLSMILLWTSNIIYLYLVVTSHYNSKYIKWAIGMFVLLFIIIGYIGIKYNNILIKYDDNGVILKMLHDLRDYSKQQEKKYSTQIKITNISRTTLIKFDKILICLVFKKLLYKCKLLEK